MAGVKYKVVGFGKISGPSMDTERGVFADHKLDVEAVEIRPTSEDELIALAKDADAIMGGGGPFFSRKLMSAVPKCRIIVFYSVGFDGVDVQAATDNGIVFVNNPAREWCVEEVSNHAIVLLMACAKKLVMLDTSMKRGSWGDARKVLAPMAPIHGQTLGLVACGDIGRMTAKKAQAFNMKVIGYDPYADKAQTKAAGIELVSLPDLLGRSDFVSVHAPLAKETFHLIGEKEFKQMKPGAYFINTARGPIVDEQALIKALQQKWIAGAGLDVFEKEPTPPDNPLLKMDNVIALPHTASYSDAALAVQPVNPAEEVVRVLSGHWPKNPVNPNVKPKFTLTK
jgi:D-3-phosphoglycerate dehydrogenase / 2-oxoglutarate reductase